MGGKIVTAGDKLAAVGIRKDAKGNKSVPAGGNFCHLLDQSVHVPSVVVCLLTQSRLNEEFWKTNKSAEIEKK